ncbi:MAG: DUF1501 domain-containing protein [Bdellovibrionaceae bacterium]|nr:DUF1501 domain-containing protein [Pseudobdellovibrionaceae bacterium]
MNRRDFLKTSGSFALAASLAELAFLPAARAQGEAPWFFVQIAITGGWDITLGADPWLTALPDQRDMYIEYNPSDIARIGNIAFGPSMLPIKNYASRLCVVNGVFLSPSDNGHGAAERYMQSGSTNQSWGDFGVEVLETRPAELMGVATNSSVYLGVRGQLVTQLGNVPSFMNGSSAPFQSSQNDRNLISRIEAGLAGSAQKLKTLKDIVEMFKQQGSNVGDLHHLAGLFGAGLSQIGVLSFNENLDTHAAHPGTHLAQQTKAWEKVAEVFDLFSKVEVNGSGQSLLDRTTFMITSEFSRTAALNTSNGKDHNPLTNSVVLLGPRIKGGTTIGGSNLVTHAQSKTGSSYHIASPIDPATGLPTRVREGARIIRPENVAATLIESLGISRKRFASVPDQTLSLSKWALK